jgi:hypothetical protein
LEECKEALDQLGYPLSDRNPVANPLPGVSVAPVGCFYHSVNGYGYYRHGGSGSVQSYKGGVIEPAASICKASGVPEITTSGFAEGINGVFRLMTDEELTVFDGTTKTMVTSRASSGRVPYPFAVPTPWASSTHMMYFDGARSSWKITEKNNMQRVLDQSSSLRFEYAMVGGRAGDLPRYTTCADNEYEPILSREQCDEAATYLELEDMTSEVVDSETTGARAAKGCSYNAAGASS